MISSEYKNEEGHLLPLEELSPGQLLTLKISEIDNPIYQAVWKVIEEAQYDIKKKFEVMDEKVQSKLNNLFKWAKDNNMSRMDAFKIMINEKTGNLYARLDSDFYKKLHEATIEKSVKGIKFVKDNYEFRDKEQFKKDYETRLEGFKATEKARYNNFKATVDLDGNVVKTAKSQKSSYDKSIEQWIINNDLITSDLAWVNDINRKRYLKIKDETVQSNYSPEYKKIKSIAPINEFYNMWTEYMEEFQNILGITDYKTLPSNFIPNIRKEVMEYISSDGLSNLVLKNDNNDLSILKSLLGILNSSTINYWFSYYYFDVNIKPEQLRAIPIPNDYKNDRLISIVGEVLKINGDISENPLADTASLETQIDQLVYQLYDLTAEEIAIIENGIK